MSDTDLIIMIAFAMSPLLPVVMVVLRHRTTPPPIVPIQPYISAADWYKR